MQLHWTYETPPDENEDLRQGDIIFPSEDLRRVMREMHPALDNPKYLGFIVITQCCDLVRRRHSKCKAEFINLAVIQDLFALVESLLDGFCEKIGPRVYKKGSRLQAEQLITRILNQNEQAIGLFYLHPDEVLGIGSEAVALLRVSVPLRSEDFYDIIRFSRRGRLGPEFRNKLGWLVGNLYSRVGTPDWTEKANGEATFREISDKFLDSAQFSWVDDACVNHVVRKGVSLQDRSHEEIISILEENMPDPPNIRVAKISQTCLQKILDTMPLAIVASMSEKLRSKSQSSEDPSRANELSEIFRITLQEVLSELPTDIANKVISRTTDENNHDKKKSQYTNDQWQEALEAAIREEMLGLSNKFYNRLVNSRILPLD